MKRVFKLLISLALYCADLIRSLFGKPPGTCAVLYYHEVVQAERVRFAAQLDVIRRVATPVSALTPSKFESGRKYVAITIDDAFISFFKNGLPEMEARNMPALVFVPTAWLGRKVDWAMEEVMASPNERISTLAELKEFAKRRLVRFGSHTVNHRKLSVLNDAESLKELSESKEFLEREFGGRIETVSFPYGGFTERDVKLATELGYKACFSTSPKTTDHLGEGVIGRFRVDPSDWMLEVKLKAAGAYRWQSYVQRLRRRLRGEPQNSTARVSPAVPA